MSTNKKTFDSKSSLKNIATMLAFITEHGPVTAAAVRAHTKLSENYNGAFLRHMAKKNLIHETAAQVRMRRGSYPIIWAAGPAPTAEGYKATDEIDDFKQKVVIRKEWEPMHMRVRLDCYLFGVPAALQGAAVSQGAVA